MKRKKDSKNKVVYFNDCPPTSAVYVVRFVEGNVVLEKEGHIIRTFPEESIDCNNICMTLKECQNIINNKKIVLYAERPTWMRK